MLFEVGLLPLTTAPPPPGQTVGYKGGTLLGDLLNHIHDSGYRKRLNNNCTVDFRVHICLIKPATLFITARLARLILIKVSDGLHGVDHFYGSLKRRVSQSSTSAKC